MPIGGRCRGAGMTTGKERPGCDGQRMQCRDIVTVTWHDPCPANLWARIIYSRTTINQTARRAPQKMDT